MPSVRAYGKSSMMALLESNQTLSQCFPIFVNLLAEAGQEATGIGFKASLFEAKAAIGTNIAVQLGVNVDTEVGVGFDGTTAKVLGTGVSLSRSKGLNFCVFGICLIIG